MNLPFRLVTRDALQTRVQSKPFLKYLWAIALASAIPSSAATLTITSTGDSGPNTLRNAIATAGSEDTINFNLPAQSTITLTSGTLIIGKNLTITGPGAMQIAISGNHTSTVFSIDSGVTASISGLTIENGSSEGQGGGIHNSGTLTISNTTVSGNSSSEAGGGIYNDGALTLTNSTLSGNSAPGTCSGGLGGGILNDRGGSLTVTNSTLTGNSSQCGGGGIENFGMLTLTNSTLSSNSAGFEGGGLDNNNDGVTAVINSTIAGNSASLGGGIGNFQTITLKGTVLANNTTGGNCRLPSALTSLGNNLADDNTCGLSSADGASGDEQVSSAGLDPHGLQNNGGPTQTIALLPTSPAVNRIPVAACTDANGNPLKTDQRAITRPQGAACDSGAFELVETVPFESFHPALTIGNGKNPGFVLASTFTLGSASTGLNPASETMTLKIASYTLTLPAGSFHKLWNAANAPYAYEGSVNGATLVLGLISLGNNTFSFDAAGAPVSFLGIKNPVTVTLTFDNDTGTTSVQAVITSH